MRYALCALWGRFADNDLNRMRTSTIPKTPEHPTSANMNDNDKTGKHISKISAESRFVNDFR
jgi:hypothetical protein